MRSEPQSARLLNAVLWLIAGAFLLACVTAPPIFNGLIALGRHVEALEVLRDLEFESIIARLLLIYIVLGFYPVVRLAGATSMEPFGLRRDVPWAYEIAKGWLFGVVSVGVMCVVAAWAGAYVWAPDPVGKLAGRVLTYLVGAFLIGWLEEILFRGALFGLLRRVVAWIPAALVVSVFFAVVHFLRPESPGGIVYGHWYAGFSLVPHMFFMTEDTTHYVPFAFTLFAMSGLLCLIYQRVGHIYSIIGLHAGWVLALQSGKFFFDRDREVWPILFGTSSNLSRSWAAFCVVAVMLIIVLLWPVRKGRAARAVD